MRFLLGIFALSAIMISCGQNSSIDQLTPGQVTNEGLKWYNIEDLDKMDQLDGKLVLVDMYTNWCGWCKVMDKKTFTDPTVVEYLNEHFVLVKFNAEQRKPVTFKGKTFEWVKRGRNGTHQLALDMMNNRAGYPTLVYLNDQLDVITAVPGYKKPDQLLADLRKVQAQSVES